MIGFTLAYAVMYGLWGLPRKNPGAPLPDWSSITMISNNS